MSQIETWADKFKKISDAMPAPTNAAQFGSDFESPMTMDHVPHPAYWTSPPTTHRHPDYDVFGAEGSGNALPEDFRGQHVPFGEEMDFEAPVNWDDSLKNEGRRTSFGLGVIIPSTYKPPPKDFEEKNPTFGQPEGRNPQFGQPEGRNPQFGAEGDKSIMGWLAPVAAILSIWMGVEWMAKKARNAELIQRLHGHHHAGA